MRKKVDSLFLLSLRPRNMSSITDTMVTNPLPWPLQVVTCAMSSSGVDRPKHNEVPHRVRPALY
jgi:hypothetical protein